MMMQLNFPQKALTKFVTTLVITLSLASASAFSAEEVSQQLTAPSHANIDIKVQRGNVKIIGWDKNLIQVEGTLDALSKGLVFKKDGDEFTIEDKLPRSYSGKRGQGSNLVINVPNKTDIEIEGISSDYNISQLVGEIELEVVSGNINASDLDGDIELSAVSGNIQASQLSGDIELETVSGNINDNHSQGEVSYRLVSGDLTASSQATKIKVDQVSGKIDGNFKPAKHIKVVAVSGDISLKLSDSLSRAKLESVSGDITTAFSNIPSVDVNINGGPAGKITNQLTDHNVIKGKYQPSSTLQFRVGNGAGKLSINTISGHLTIK
ncbi:DUF4097 domain-containing protein [Shewanella intestini]|uniref:DUF4097 domain-containing protein n=1 Tax=Shewanella intestini TaxID=2017544 RepID=A0ABS5I396_9GAMM|nr:MULTISPECIES: DUF4097 family beta strand repeat-containing protein [Shewanella]MBR9728503.1 DUF4097 domain-containing protein [Shewanella intestini]MRG36322.1 DUF4097 family beta strand repeat protein [Shewanella sp. XMDDZSB0408]